MFSKFPEIRDRLGIYSKVFTFKHLSYSEMPICIFLNLVNITIRLFVILFYLTERQEKRFIHFFIRELLDMTNDLLIYIID